MEASTGRGGRPASGVGGQIRDRDMHVGSPNEQEKAHLGRILVVDDTTANLQLLTKILSEHGYAVHPASDGELALKFVRLMLPDLILLDIRMPGMDGFEVCRRLKADERTRSIPVIFISVLEDERDKVKGLQAGAVDYISKPFQPEEVLARIGIHLKLRELTERLESLVRDRTEELTLVNDRLQRELAERVKTEEALRESETRFSRIVNAALEGIWVVQPDATTTFVNSRMTEMLGVQVEDVMGRPMTDFMFAEDLNDHRKKENNRRRGRAESYERRLRHRGGSVVWTLVSSAPVFDDEGRFQGAFAMFTDITERKQSEEKVLLLNRELEHRVAALEQANRELASFSSSLSHDLRTPLLAIEGFSHLLREEYGRKLNGDGRRYLEFIHRGAGRMDRLLDGIQAFLQASRCVMSVEAVDMTALGREVFDGMKAEMEPGREICFTLDDLPPALGDRAMFRRALGNLLDNALKFTASKPDAAIELSGRRGDGENVYCVRDNGVGFDMQYVDKLFFEFQRLHSTDDFEGAGVGLAVVKRIIERSGGRVWAEGKVGEGAAFYFTLPPGQSN
jgi:PAS domain S-box-containing protein